MVFLILGVISDLPEHMRYYESGPYFIFSLFYPFALLLSCHTRARRPTATSSNRGVLTHPAHFRLEKTFSPLFAPPLKMQHWWSHSLVVSKEEWNLGPASGLYTGQAEGWLPTLCCCRSGLEAQVPSGPHWRGLGVGKSSVGYSPLWPPCQLCWSQVGVEAQLSNGQAITLSWCGSQILPGLLGCGWRASFPLRFTSGCLAEPLALNFTKTIKEIWLFQRPDLQGPAPVCDLWSITFCFPVEKNKSN